jgi:hypothetical protein
MSSKGIIGPFFFEDETGETQTVNSTRYLELLKKKFLSCLVRRGFNPFQQDGATPHTTRNVTDWLHETFNGNFISFKTTHIWPPHSPDLSPLDFFLWGYLKDNVYKPELESLADLKHAIRREIRKVTDETCAAVIRNFKQRLNIVTSQE